MRGLGMLGVVVVASIAGAIWLTLETQQNRLVWDHFDVVKPGILYRSGQLNPDQLTEAIQSYQLKTIVSFLRPGPQVDAERELVESLGANFVNLPMPGDGFGRPEQFREVLELVDDPEQRPVLVHCARGTCRTGSAVALYRLERDGWTIEDVAKELERQSYRKGWLAGYAYSLCESWPTDALPGIPPREFSPTMQETQSDVH